VSKKEATESGLAKIDKDRVYLGVDSTTKIDHKNPEQKGRRSVRLESKDTFSDGLLVADFAHIPGNTCGMWPA
jgi:hypothetical protein